MTAFHTIAVPHEDILTGRLTMDVFAADLWEVHKGRRYAQRLEMPLTGTLGFLLLAKERGLVANLAPLLLELQEVGLYLSAALIDRALRLAGEKSSIPKSGILIGAVWRVADPAVGFERAPVQVEGQEVPPLWADHPGGDGHLR